jgi:hypothetical protein
LKFSVILLALAGLIGYASSSKAPAQESEAAKSLDIPAGRGLVYLCRTGKAIGAGNSIEVKVNGQPAGGTGPSMFFRWALKPGSYNFYSSTSESSATVALQVEAGKVYFVEQIARLGVNSGRVSMNEVDQQKGESMIQSMQLLVSAYSPE